MFAVTDNDRAHTDRIVWIDCEMTGLDTTNDKLVEIAALLATSPDGASSTVVSANIWPHAERSGVTPSRMTNRRNEYLTRLRRWLGETESGEQAFPKSGDTTGRTPHRLHPDVRSDWDVWLELVDGAPAEVSTARLAAAIFWTAK
mgnify:CR=1 FL=1